MSEKKIDKESLMEAYSTFLLEKGKRPVNVYTFAKEQGFSESEFYRFFTGFDALENEYLAYFFDRSLELAEQIEGFEQFSARERLLNLYFIFIENLTMNRSLVLMILDAGFRSEYKKLRSLKKRHRAFVDSLDPAEPGFCKKIPEKLKEPHSRSIHGMLWLHFLSVIRFWKNDQSAGFENTDAYIEKSMDTGFEIAGSETLDKLFDLGKFLWKEKF